jgi:LysR family transcriptional regulator (chromosome initiation inhibitor)
MFRMFDYKLIEALGAVCEEGGFERAAKRLNLTQSAVSQRIRLLEEQLGGPVLARTQPPAPTPPGKALLRHARRVALLEAELARDLPGESDKADGWRKLAVAVNADSLATWFAEAVLPCITRERIVLDLRVDDQERTHAQLRAGEVVGCISTRATPMQGCRTVALGVMRYHCACSPQFARRWFPAGLSLDAARAAPAVVFNRDDTVHDRYLAAVLGESPAEAPRHHVPDSDRFVTFVAGGAGFGLIPRQQAGPLLATQRLLDLAPEAPMDVPLSWHCWNVPSPTLAAMTTALRQGARRHLIQAQ